MKRAIVVVLLGVLGCASASEPPPLPVYVGCHELEGETSCGTLRTFACDACAGPTSFSCRRLGVACAWCCP